MVPEMVRVVTPGSVLIVPVAGFVIKVAAGTVIRPATVANSPVVSS